MRVEDIWREWPDAEAFSGVFAVHDRQGVLFEKARGFRNRSESLPNGPDTAFGVASVTKLFTGLAICKLMDEKKLSPRDKLWDVLPYDLGRIDRNVTVCQLLTHTSGVGDYIDEEAEDSLAALQALYDRYPVYQWERLAYYLPMITPLPPKFAPGARYGYSNAGYVLLGLVAEAASGQSYQAYVTDAVIAPCGLARTGFYRTDALPPDTAHGYIQDEETGQWRANIFKVPVTGGSDGGLYTCAADLDRLWRAVFSGGLFSGDMLQAFLKPHAAINEHQSYGWGVYSGPAGQDRVYYAVGGDFGVDCFTAYFPAQDITASALGNTELNTFPLFSALCAAVPQRTGR